MAAAENDPLGMVADSLPNIVQIVDAPAAVPIQEAVAATVDVCNQVLTALNGDLSTFMAGCLDQCKLSVGACNNCVAGLVAGGVDKLNTVLSKCQTGVANQINAAMSTVVNRVAAAGVQLPSPDTVNAIMMGVKPQEAVSRSNDCVGGDVSIVYEPGGGAICLSGGVSVGCPACATQPGGCPVCQPTGGGTGGGTGGTTPPPPSPGQTVIPPGGDVSSLKCGVGETPYTDPAGNTYCVADTFTPKPPPTLPGTGGGGGPPTLPGGTGGTGGGTGGTYTPPSIPGQPPRTCQGLTDPCANLPPGWTSQGTGYGVQFYIKVPVYDTCGNLVSCWQMPVGCKLNLPAVRYDANGCPIVTQVICDNPAKCVPPWVCADGYSYDQKTGTCTSDAPPPTPPPATCPDGTKAADDGTCPPPAPQPPPTTTPQGSGHGLDACTPSALATLWNQLNATSDQSPPQPGNAATTVSIGCDSLGILNPIKPFCTFFEGVIQQAVQYIAGLIPEAGCQNSTFVGTSETLALLQFIQQWTGALPAALIAQNRYTQNLSCQYIIPDAAAVSRLHVTGWIQNQEFEAGIAANGHCLPWERLIRDSSYRYPNVNESINLHLRGKLNVDEFHAYMRRQGVRDDQFSDLFLELSRWFPDTVRSSSWSQQGVNDQHYADVFGLDDGFLEWQQSTDYRSVGASNQSDDDARKIYRSTWLRPTLGQVIEAYQRIGTDQVLSDTGINVPAVTADELTTALTNSGIPPTWQSRIAYLQYSPISIRHLRLLYESGVIDKEELASRYQQLRYAPDDARKLAHAIVVTTDQAKAKLNGFFTAPEILRLYQRDGMTRDEAQSYLQMSGVPADSVDSLLTQAEVKRASTDQASTVQALKKRFMYGDYDPGQSQQQLIQLGIDAERVSVIVKNWQTELDLKHKQPAVNTLCDWVQRGYLTGGDYIRRMQNLGYDVGDASVYLQTCQAKQQEKNVREAIKQAKALEAAARKAAADAKKASPYKDPPKVYRTPVKTERRASVTRRNLTKNKTTVTDTVADTSVVGDETTVQESITEQTH